MDMAGFSVETGGRVPEDVGLSGGTRVKNGQLLRICRGQGCAGSDNNRFYVKSGNYNF
jgi:hypothetical protein